MSSPSLQAIATDDDLKDLQSELIESRNKNNLMPGTGGLRKIRMATEKW